MTLFWLMEGLFWWGVFGILGGLFLIFTGTLEIVIVCLGHIWAWLDDRFRSPPTRDRPPQDPNIKGIVDAALKEKRQEPSDEKNHADELLKKWDKDDEGKR